MVLNHQPRPLPFNQFCFPLVAFGHPFIFPYKDFVHLLEKGDEKATIS